MNGGIPGSGILQARWTATARFREFAPELVRGEQEVRHGGGTLPVLADGIAFVSASGELQRTVQLLPLKTDKKTDSSPSDQFRRENIPPRELAAAGGGDGGPPPLG